MSSLFTLPLILSFAMGTVDSGEGPATPSLPADRPTIEVDNRNGDQSIPGQGSDADVSKPSAGDTGEELPLEFAIAISAEPKTEIRLEAIPRSRKRALFMSSANVILNKKTALPKAIRVIGPSGTMETVYVFTKWITVPRGRK